MAAASVWQLQQLPPHGLRNSLLSLPSNHSSACPPVAYSNKKHVVSGRANLLLCTSSGASSSVVTKEQEVDSSPEEEASSEPARPSYRDDPNFRGCRGCGRDELERGCNGEGRIQGGIAAIPGFGWWPIKAYRPCPGFVASGGRYRRQGQSMDDVASGRGKKEPDWLGTKMLACQRFGKVKVAKKFWHYLVCYQNIGTSHIYLAKILATFCDYILACQDFGMPKLWHSTNQAQSLSSQNEK